VRETAVESKLVIIDESVHTPIGFDVEKVTSPVHPASAYIVMSREVSTIPSSAKNYVAINQSTVEFVIWQ
jgi:hypothetical protein